MKSLLQRLSVHIISKYNQKAYIGDMFHYGEKHLRYEILNITENTVVLKFDSGQTSTYTSINGSSYAIARDWKLM